MQQDSADSFSSRLHIRRLFHKLRAELIVDPDRPAAEEMREKDRLMDKSQYDRYLRSRAWRVVKERFAEKAKSVGTRRWGPHCFVCGQGQDYWVDEVPGAPEVEWGPGNPPPAPLHVQIDLHHNTYKRLGAELPEDLVRLCRSCHERVHKRAEEVGDTHSFAQIVALEAAEASQLMKNERLGRST